MDTSTEVLPAPEPGERAIPAAPAEASVRAQARPAARSSRGARDARWIVAGGAALALIGIGAFGVATNNRDADVAESTTRETVLDAADSDSDVTAVAESSDDQAEPSAPAVESTNEAAPGSETQAAPGSEIEPEPEPGAETTASDVGVGEPDSDPIAAQEIPAAESEPGSGGEEPDAAVTLDVVASDSDGAGDAPSNEAGGDAPPESVAIVRNGQIYFEGAVPTQEQGDEIVQLAIDILGEANVFNNYVVDPRAGDPSIGNITVEDTITFGSDSAQVLPAADTLLGQGLALMTVRPAMTVTIVGHTDDRGSLESNERLSLARAEAVKAWFVERGIDPERLSTQGAGPTVPVASNDTPEGRQENRRIQFFLENVLGE